MLAYYLDLARRSLRRNRGLTILMIVAIAFGVGASMTTLTVLHVLSADPIPQKSDRLFYAQLDPGKLAGYIPGRQPHKQLTRRDAEALLRAKRGVHQAFMTGGEVSIEPETSGLKPFVMPGRYTTPDFFAMFDTPFAAGGAYTTDDEDKHARVIVIGRALAEKLYGTVSVIGRSIRIDNTELRIVGVLETWAMRPMFYDLTIAPYDRTEELWIPFSTSIDLKLEDSGSLSCWDDAIDPRAVGAACGWLQYWVELDKPSDVEAYRDFLIQYSEDEHKAGRFERPPNVRLRNVTQWLAYNHVVPDDVQLQTWIALGFLLVCLINTIGLLLTKFLRRSVEIGVRRALGASKRAIFAQLLVEAGMIGFAGGVLGLGLAWLGLWAVRHQPTPYATLAHFDLPMLITTLGLALLSSLLAGLLPAWRGCQVAPAIQLKAH